MVYVLVFARGLVNTVDNPARQSFVASWWAVSGS
jgi:hypothetical protein